MKLIRILLKWKYIQDKIMPFWPLCCKNAELFCLVSFVLVTCAGVVLNPALNTSNFCEEKSASRDLESQASPVDEESRKGFELVATGDQFGTRVDQWQPGKRKKAKITRSRLKQLRNEKNIAPLTSCYCQ